MISQPTQQSSHPCYLTLSTYNSFPIKKQQIHICTQIITDKIISIQHSSNIIIMQIYLYTLTNSYFNTLSTNHLNKQLNWNQKFVSLLKKSLSGKNKNIVVEFNDANLNFKLYSELEQNSIRILLLQLNLIKLAQKPQNHKLKICRIVDKKYKNYIKYLQMINKKQTHEIDQIQNIQKQLIQKHEYETTQIKQQFITIINEIKKKLRIQFGIEDLQKNDDNFLQNCNRPIYRIKSIGNKIGRQSENFMKLFQ